MVEASHSYIGLTGNKSLKSNGFPQFGSFNILQIQNDRVYTVGEWSLNGNKTFNDKINYPQIGSQLASNDIWYFILFLTLLLAILIFTYFLKGKKHSVSFKDFIEQINLKQLREIHHKILTGLGRSEVQGISVRSISSPPQNSPRWMCFHSYRCRWLPLSAGGYALA